MFVNHRQSTSVSRFTAGVSGFLNFSQSGAPERSPKVVDRLNKEVNEALADPAVKTRMAEIGSEIFPGSPADFGKLVAEETEKWATVIKFRRPQGEVKKHFSGPVFIAKDLKEF